MSRSTRRGAGVPRPGTGPLRVLQYGVHDTGYPRNVRVRAHLERQLGASVVIAPRSRAARRSLRAIDDVRALLRGARHADVVLLSEFRLGHAPLAWLVARLHGAVLVVDGFVGLYETVVDDWRRVSPASPAALRFRVLDAAAVRFADVYLVDTEPRAAEIVRRHAPSAPVLALAVGAPAWATWQPPAPPHDALRVLYYGGYIPLHGVDLVIDALALVGARRRVEVVLVGDGPARRSVEARVARAGLADRCAFVDAVAESELVDHIARADVVLGVFGSSTKARGVVANKVWQGLACGRTVITQRSSALDDVRREVGGLLVQTEPASASSIADALVAARPADQAPAPRDVAARLEATVQRSYDRFSDHLAALGLGLGPVRS
ncbi:glycosyltransferase [Frigoribacterium sp. VKM Ac-2836]|uniref:glycosyltransferase n=1 Tax=Frigoribacterium sp. VKM Ac-2836 TaxID=2739014 RepID=UPI001566D9DA|nr:glycosyltransferase [Frigoribacterium sp. VKM Ac-2836]NRD27893.1 glycosyltransferase [Frigoribacterium sp. VKM Ac-2836]